MLKTKRVYEDATASDGVRFLVERLWPRGMKKRKLRMKAWLKEVAPSQSLRRWYAHDPLKWGNSSSDTALSWRATEMRGGPSWRKPNAVM